MKTFPIKLFQIVTLTGFSASFLLATNPASAINLIKNGSFENSSLGSGFGFVELATDSTAINDWKVTSGGIDYVNAYWQNSNGSFSLDLSRLEAGSIAQTFVTKPGNQYSVSFDLAGNPVGDPTVKTLRLSAGGSSQDFTFDVTGKTLANMGWLSKTFSFVADSNSTTLSFASLDNTAHGPALDNVVVTATAVPWETDALPVVGSTVLFGFGLWCKNKLSQNRSKSL
ncbi:choice-of-anchor C family protein [Dolichospermum circinale]|uniref:Choice-of-anchor C family protein n=1 Tax=Dolichospermum circinale CS-537/01 TaxID=3021739 RepID=A0ABT5A682_9CYAN|nr:choice-of-anchor C family protein [Dolichospermum circinale]MDB9465939.1 choice-of-anchor C family protein [Dolichospermum circinale CS-539/09]MDB9471097.1 choice-of-anchor C family protein [Dolichospermum circinale CS-539]MDB9487457.1 choice-of-anchor C family protein [Dolichospermum circinale CS-537/01]